MKTFSEIWALLKKVYPNLSIVRLFFSTVYFGLICSASTRNTAIRYLEALASGYYVMVVTSFAVVPSDEATTDRMLTVGTYSPKHKFGAPVLAVGYKKVFHELLHYVMEPDARFLVRDTSVSIKEGTLVACLKDNVIDLSIGKIIPAERTFT
jgi:hypothetical protein